MGKIYTRVSRIADWAGWCSPCALDDRPLVLTRSGPGGLTAWLAGHGDDDRLLLLTCRVCGGWQFVPAREEDDPEILLVEDAEDGVGEAIAEVPVEAQAVHVPAPRAAVPRIVSVAGPVTRPAFSAEAVLGMPVATSQVVLVSAV